jgi:hypothetical protein
MTARILPIRMNLTEAIRLYVAEADLSGERSLFGFNLREETDHLTAAWYDFDRAIERAYLRLYARQCGQGGAWKRVHSSYYSGTLRLQINRESAECEVWPRFMAIVPTEFSVLRSDVVRLIKGKHLKQWWA